MRAFTGKANALRALGRRDEAEVLSREALVHADAVGAQNPALPELLVVLSRTLNELGRPAEAIPLLQRAQAIEKENASQLGAAPMIVLAESLRKTGQSREAEKFVSAAITQLEATPESDRAQLADARFELAQLAWATPKRQAEARALAQKAFAALSEVEGNADDRSGRMQAWLKSHLAP